MKGMTDSIFWKMHTAFLKNDRQAATMFLGMLEDEEAHCPRLRDETGPIHYARYQLIRDAIKSGTFGRLYGAGSETPIIDQSGATNSDGTEAVFHRKLIQPEGRAKLYECLGIAKEALLTHELEMEPYGRCDFVVREGRTWHCIEVKMGEAKSSVVSQIDKYRLAMELEMTWGLHDRVNAVVIAENFSPYVAAELARLSVDMVKHNGEPNSLRKI